jgi:hypothetical protein
MPINRNSVDYNDYLKKEYFSKNFASSRKAIIAIINETLVNRTDNVETKCAKM